jgi:membrane fusion protein, copper/silver efflux system
MSTPTTRSRGRLLLIAPAALIAGAAIWIIVPAGAGQETGMDGHQMEAVGPNADHDMAGMTMDDGTVHLTPELRTSLGVTTVEAELAPLDKVIRTSANVAYDETRLTVVSPKFGGFVEQLHVDFTGQSVRRGQPLLEIYSPDLVAAQEELLSALRMTEQLEGRASDAVLGRTRNLVDAARRRLLLWDVSPAQVAEVERTGQVRRTLTLHAPFGGFVTEKLVQAGQSVMPGMPLYRLADLSTVWVEADVYEQDLRFVRLGAPVDVAIDAYPGETFSGRVTYVYPEVRADTRTARVRAELSNPGARLKPGMYATVVIEAPVTERAVLVPRDAVMHSGTHAMVFVEVGENMYRAREVQVGSEVGGRTQILSGLLAGERVVQRANFLLDSESRLMESMGAMPGMNH